MIQPKISFIIVNFNGREHLKECFATLSELDYPQEKLEYIMVDNGSVDDSIEFVQEHFPYVKILRNTTNEGFAKPNNDAAKVAEGEYLALINNDMRVSSEWVNDMLSTLEGCDASYACVGSKILNWDGSKLDFCGGSVNYLANGYQYNFGAKVEDIDCSLKDKDLLFACGGAMLIKRQVFLEVGGFDEDYFAYFEDVDLGWRLWLLGYKTRFCSRAVCYHKHNSTSKKMNRTKVQTMFARNSLYTLYKNYSEENLYKVLSAALMMKNYKGTQDSFEDEDNLEEGIAQFYGIQHFTSNLDKMSAKREYIQKNRQVEDKYIINRFFTEPYKNLYMGFPDSSFFSTQQQIIKNLRIEDTFGMYKNKVLIISGDAVGKKMAGTSIRTVEMAKELSKGCDVALAAPKPSDFSTLPSGIRGIEFDYQAPNPLFDGVIEAYIIIVQGTIMERLPELKHYASGKVVVMDLYDPYVIENLEIHKNKSLDLRNEIHKVDLEAQVNQLQIGDYFICANEKQLDLWIGMLSTLNKVNPEEVSKGSKLQRLIDVVPFGISEQEPVRTRQNAILEKIPTYKEGDKVILWGGGVWNWFDPLTCIRAVAKISKHRDDIKLFFMGIKHPNPEIPEMEMTLKAIKLAEELGVKDKQVFFNEDWVDYNDRQNFILDCYAGVSCHFNTLETRYSFRTRVLDYLWARLPILCTEGDYFADLVQREGLGIVVPYEDADKMAEAMLRLIEDQDFYGLCKSNIDKVRERFKWSNTMAPLLEFCKNPEKKKREKSTHEMQLFTDIKQKQRDGNIGGLMAGTRVGQRFRCRFPNLSLISVQVGTFARENNHEIFFKLYDYKTQTLLAEKSVSAKKLRENQWVDIEFKPIANSEGRELYFYFEAPEASSDNCITLWKSSEVSDAGRLLINGDIQEGSLCYVTKFVYEEGPLDKEEVVLIPEKGTSVLSSIRNSSPLSRAKKAAKGMIRR